MEEGVSDFPCVVVAVGVCLGDLRRVGAIFVNLGSWVEGDALGKWRDDKISGGREKVNNVDVDGGKYEDW